MTKPLRKIRTGQVSMSRSPILGHDTNLPFWVDDRVRVKSPSDELCHLVPFGGYPPGVRLVREIRACGDEILYHLSDHLYGGWEEVVPADNLELVERGNIWRLSHDEPTIFRTWKEELDCHLLLGSAHRVEHLADADAFAMFVPEYHFAHAPARRLYRFDDRVVGERVRLEAMKGY